MNRLSVHTVLPDLTLPCARFQCAVDFKINSNCFSLKGFVIIASMEEQQKISKKDLLEMLENMIKIYDGLPPGAMLAPISHYDYHSLLLLLLALFREEVGVNQPSDHS